MKKHEHELTVMIFWASIISLALVFFSAFGGISIRAGAYIRVAVLLCLPVITAFFSGLMLAKERSKKSSPEKMPTAEVQPSQPWPRPETTCASLLMSIASLIRSSGEPMPKKHGNWIVLQVGDHFFSMDSWNGAIEYKSGEPKYEYWTGFSGDGKESVYLGLSDSSWRHNDALPLDLDAYQGFYNQIRTFINDQIVKKKETANDHL